MAKKCDKDAEKYCAECKKALCDFHLNYIHNAVDHEEDQICGIVEHLQSTTSSAPQLQQEFKQQLHVLFCCNSQYLHPHLILLQNIDLFALQQGTVYQVYET